jgi:hypothetical protein
MQPRQKIALRLFPVALRLFSVVAGRLRAPIRSPDCQQPRAGPVDCSSLQAPMERLIQYRLSSDGPAAQDR